jgi:hypothetical protein
MSNLQCDINVRISCTCQKDAIGSHEYGFRETSFHMTALFPSKILENIVSYFHCFPSMLKAMLGQEVEHGAKAMENRR